MINATTAPATATVHHVTCPLCEATCGLDVTTSGRSVLGIRGNRDDVFSHGYICPKAYALKELDADPDRLRAPLIREGATWREATWDEAFAEIERRLLPILRESGRDALAVYLGNPNVHNLSGLLYNTPLLHALGTSNVYSASTLDQMPKQVSAGLMFGTMLSIPIPDIDATDYLLILGANPLVSNGSLFTAPDMRGRVRALMARGGKVVVVDPRRTRTAEEASQHIFVRPGSDAYLLFALVHTLFAEGLARPGRLVEYTTGFDELCVAAEVFSPEAVEGVTGVPAETIRRLARELAAAERAAVYGRIGTCTQAFGTIASWLVDALNILTGNLDRPGGALFPKPAAGARNTSGARGVGPGVRLWRRRSRVRGAPEVYGEYPVACLAEEIETPGEGRVRALLTIAGNPALSAPNGDRLDAALSRLDFMVSIDLYLNETSRHADVILPVPSPLERSHYDLAFYQLSARNIAHYSQPIFPRPAGVPDEWELLLRLTGIAAGKGAGCDVAALDDALAYELVAREVRAKGSPVEGRDPVELLAAAALRRGPERLLDFLLRVGPYGDGFGARPGGLTLERLEREPNGVDLGALQPRIPEVLRTPSGMIELAPEPLLADVARLREALERAHPPMVLIGRRELRSNNSWMHNLPALMKGDIQCTLLMHPDDAARVGLAEGDEARVTSAVGSVLAPVRVTEAIMRGVVSLPHGWGHSLRGAQLAVASEHVGVNVNRLMGDAEIEPLSGNAILTAVAVTVEPVTSERAAGSPPLSLA